MPDAERHLDALLADLRAAGGRVTTARRAVLGELLAGGGAHVSAQEIASRVQAAHPDIHRSTVYRTLEALESLGLVAHVHLGHGPSTYHLADAIHHHAVCQECGAVIELPPDVVDGLAGRLRDEFDFTLCHHFALVGRCAACISGARST